MFRALPLQLLLAGSMLVWSGCRPEAPVVQYRVPKARQPVSKVQPDKAWFVKLSGPIGQVIGQLEPFVKLIADVEFPEGQPKFNLPEGWQEQPGDQFRHSTILVGNTDPPLEVAVSSLGYAATQREPYTLANVNRWRGQLGLEPWDASNWRSIGRESQELLSFDIEGYHLEIVRLMGTTEEHGQTLMLAAMYLPISDSEPPTQSLAEAATPPVAAAPAPFKYELPTGWEAAAGSSVRVASFKASSAAGELDIGVTRFPGGGDLLPNINRWRGQVALDPITEAEVESAMTPVDVSGIASLQGEFNGPEQGILVAAVPDGDAQWFFKAQGPVAAINAEREKFLTFLQSVKFDSK